MAITDLPEKPAGSIQIRPRNVPPTQSDAAVETCDAPATKSCDECAERERQVDRRSHNNAVRALRQKVKYPPTPLASIHESFS